jgi:hypothetical protein
MPSRKTAKKTMTRKIVKIAVTAKRKPKIARKK